MTDKYFPKKPDDVTCATCPYGQFVAETMICARQVDAYTAPRLGWCGEHPWFVAERERLKSEALAYALNPVLSDRLSDLAHNLSK